MTAITVVRPNPSAVNMFNMCSAIGEGYMAEEGLEITMQAVDGVSPVLQAMIAGQAQIGVVAPGPVLAAKSQASGPGEEPVMFYNLFAQSTYGLVVPDASGVTAVEDLAGTVIGVGTADGAEVAFSRGILAESGLEEGSDYEFLSVGDGGPAAAAFERGDIQAYSSAVPDMAILAARGVPTRELTPDEYLQFFGIGFGATEQYIDENPEIIGGFTRALVRGMEFGLANKDEAIAHCAEINPEEGADTDLTSALYDTMVDRMTPVGGGDWGVFPDGAWEAWQESLLDSGDMDDPEDDIASAYTNEFAEEANQ
jgi:NitT/TauT family transport system substrate-binding protein